MATYDDPRILRAIAHPTRNRILAEIGATGTSRAADLAQALEIPANQASFHLRQLAKYGLVEEAPEQARDKRDRVWRLSDPSGISFRTRDVISQPGGEAAVEVFRHTASARAHLLVESIYTDPVDDSTERVVSETGVRLSNAEVLEFSSELQGLVDSWRDRTRGDDVPRTTYSVFQMVQPYPALHEDIAEPVRVRGFGATGDEA